MALLATASTSSVEPRPEFLYGWLRMESASVWLLFATLSLTVGLAAQHLASRVPSLYRHASFLGFGAAATLLGSAFWGFTVPFGFQTHILATLAVVVGVLEVSIPRPELMRAVLVLSMCGTVTAHSWTLAAAYLIAPWSWAVWCALREPARRLRTALVLCTAAAALSVGPLVFALSTQVGVSRAAVYGAAAAAPVTWVLGGLLGNAALLRWRGLAAAPLAASALGLACTVALTFHVGASLADYYPSKMLWLGAVLGVPAVWVVGARALQVAAAKISPLLSMGRSVALTFGVMYAVISMATPVAAISDKSVQTRGAAVLQAVGVPDAADAEVVWGAADSATEDALVRILLDAYAPARRPTPIAVLDVSEECGLLAAAEDPAVLSRHSPEEVSQRYSCAPNVRTVEIPSTR